MTENEAIYRLKRPPHEVWKYGIADLEWNNAVEFAISSLEEIQQYREIGTVDEIQKMKKEEDILKFYYCESEDEYYIGKRIDTMYYAKYSKTGFTWCMSRYLPWGKHVAPPNTFLKEHTYPSEPKEIPFFEWLQGFIKKECLGTVEECREAMEKQRVRELELYVDFKDAKLIKTLISELMEIAYMSEKYEESIIKLAADTIEAFTATLDPASIYSDAYYSAVWISCKVMLPEEKINPVTQDFYEYQVTYKSDDMMDVRHYKFGNGHWWNGGENMDKYVIAWQTLPEPYAR